MTSFPPSTEISASVSVPENLNEIETLDNHENIVIDVPVDISDDVESYDEWKESDLWKQTRPISVIKNISQKIKCRRASERRR